MTEKDFLKNKIDKYSRFLKRDLTKNEEKLLSKLTSEIEHLTDEDKKRIKKEILSGSLEEKIVRSKMLIIDWYCKYDGKVYVSFSGGKDSTVLLHLVRSIFPDVPAVFADTGLEYPEIKEFVKTIENVTVIRPKMSFKQVLEKYGFPIISKEQSQYIEQYKNAKSEKTKNTRWNGNKWGQGKISEKWKYLVNAPFKITDKCCNVFKKDPFKRYEKETRRKPIVGVMAGESSQRLVYYLKGECNAFNAKRPISKPIFFWNEVDVWKYIRDFNVSFSKIYNMGYERTGCMFCMFGTHHDEKGNTRFHKMKKTHPKLYNYCMDKLGLKKVLDIYLKRDFEKD